MDCYLHPGTAATGACVACSQPICQECREEVAGHAMCHSCVAAAAARLSAAPAAAPPVAETAKAVGLVEGAAQAFTTAAVEADRPKPAPPHGAGFAPRQLIRPGFARRVIRGTFWGVTYGQWWTLWSTLSLFLWGQGSFDSNLVGFVVDRGIVNGFFGCLAGIIIGAMNAPTRTGVGIGIGAGMLVCLLRLAQSQNPLMLVNLFFYYVTGRFVGAAIAWRVQQPAGPRASVLSG